MAPNDALQRVLSVELLADVFSESISNPARRQLPARDFPRIGPQQVAEAALVALSSHDRSEGYGRDLLHAIQLLDLVDGAERWREASVDGEIAVVDDGADRQIAEQVREVAPDPLVSVLLNALFVEPIASFEGELGGNTICLVAHFRDCHE